MSTTDLSSISPGQATTRRSRFRLNSQTSRSIARFRQSPLSVAGLVIIVVILFVAAVGPLLVPFPQDATGTVHIADRFAPPSWDHLFGTDHMGRDVFSRTIIGARVSLLAGLTVILLAVVIGTLLGAIAAFGIARSGKLFVRAVIGMVLGFAYFVVDNFALAMGNLGAYPPLLAAWAPFVLFLLIGEAVLIRTEE